MSTDDMFDDEMLMCKYLDNEYGILVITYNTPGLQILVQILKICSLKDEPFDRKKYLREQRLGDDSLPPLHYAARSDNLASLAVLVPFYRCLGVSINHVYCGYTALDYAVLDNRITCVKYLLEQPDVKLVVPPHQLIPTLFNSIGFSRKYLTELLLSDDRADVNALNRHGLNALLYAARSERTDIVKLLLDLPSSYGLEKSVANKKLTLSFYACRYGYIPMIDLLMDYECFDCLKQENVDSPENYRGMASVAYDGELNMTHMSPLAHGFMHGQRNVMKKLLPLLSDDVILRCLRTSMLNGSGCSKLFTAVVLEHVEYLPEHESNWMTILFTAVRSPHTTAVILIAKALTPHVGWSWRAVLQKSLSVARRLVGGEKMMRALFDLWWRMWEVRGYCTRVYKMSFSSLTEEAIERDVRNDMYDDLRYVHGYGIAEKDIIDEMLLFSVHAGLVRNLQFIVKMNRGNRCVRARRFTETFPRCGTSLLNKAAEHEDVFQWLTQHFRFAPSKLQMAKQFEKWYQYNRHCSHKIPAKKNTLRKNGSAFRKHSFCVIDDMKVLFEFVQQTDYRSEVVSAVNTFMIRFSELLSHTCISYYLFPEKSDLRVELRTSLEGSVGMLACEPKLVGSAKEGTRPFLPDEYDYMLVLTNLRKYVRIENDAHNITMCHPYLNELGQRITCLQRYVHREKFDLYLFKIDMDRTIHSIFYKLFNMHTGRFENTNLYRDWAFLETKDISTLHLRWYGEHYKDMPISIDLVPCIEFYEYEPVKLAPQYVVGECKHYVLPKRASHAEMISSSFPVASTTIEQALMKNVSHRAREGYKLAKAIRLTSLITQECAEKLTVDVTNIHDCLKTYMLKTCLFILHQSLQNTNDLDLLPEQWALLIYTTLLEYVIRGELLCLFDCYKGDNIDLSPFRCDHELQFLLDNEHLRAACCDKRINIFHIASHLRSVLLSYCRHKQIDTEMEHVRRIPYDHNAELI